MKKDNHKTVSVKAICFMVAFLYFFYGYCITELRIHRTQDNTLQVSGIDRDELMKINGINTLARHYSINCTSLANNQETSWARKFIEKEGSRHPESYLLIMKDQKAKELAILSIQAAGGSISPDNAEKATQIKSLMQDNHWRISSMILCFFGVFASIRK